MSSPFSSPSSGRSLNPVPPSDATDAPADADKSGSDAAPSKPRRCPGFEPQRWRSGWCKNCFRRAADHRQDQDVDQSDSATAADATTDEEHSRQNQQSILSGHGQLLTGGNDNALDTSHSREQGIFSGQIWLYAYNQVQGRSLSGARGVKHPP